MGQTNPVQIPGSRIFDFDKKICDHTSALPHMMPTPEQFEEEVRSLGINIQSAVIVYDSRGIYASPRARWMFKAMGHNSIAVLDGGLPAWIEAGLAVESRSINDVRGEKNIQEVHHQPELFCNAESVAKALNDRRYTVLDARSEGRFFGREPEPRSGLRPGHMPSALNLPFNEVLSKGRFRPIQELSEILISRAPER